MKNNVAINNERILLKKELMTSTPHSAIIKFDIALLRK